MKKILRFLISSTFLFIACNCLGQIVFTDFTIFNGTSLGKEFDYIESSDINGDDLPDIVVTTLWPHSLLWFENLGNTYDFNDPKIIFKGTRRTFDSHLEIADLDSDGDQDILYSTSSLDGLIWLENVNQGNGWIVRSFPKVVATNSVLTEDFDLDGDLDLVTCGWEVNHYENVDGKGDFSHKETFFEDESVEHYARSFDIDYDGDKDLIYWRASRNNQGSDYIFYHENIDGFGQFGQQDTLIQLTEVRDIDFADFDSDGIEELLITRQREKLSGPHGGLIISYSIIGKKLVLNQTLEDTIENVNFSELCDIDLDGDLDVVSTSPDWKEINTIYVYENVNGIFEQATKISREEKLIEFLTCSDINEDGFPDLIAGSESAIIGLGNLGKASNSLYGNVAIGTSSTNCTTTIPIPSPIKFSIENDFLKRKVFSDANGNFSLNLVNGDYSTKVLTQNSLFDAVPMARNVEFNNSVKNDTISFCLIPNSDSKDVGIHFHLIYNPRPGFPNNLMLTVSNYGNQVISPEVKIEYDPNILLFFENNNIVVFGDSVLLKVKDLDPFEVRKFNLACEILPPPHTNIGDTLRITGLASLEGVDVNVDNNKFGLLTELIGSFDPNDIQILNQNYVRNIDIDSSIFYKIRFQNTGTASAINVDVRLDVNDNLEAESFRLVESSHSCTTIIDDNEVNFKFNEINLPDSTSNEERSHGYIIYSITIKDSLKHEMSILIQANIYFDFNEPISTNLAELIVTIDADGDGFFSDVDCNDEDALINPLASEIQNNNVDENCDGIVLIIDVDGDGFNSDDDCNDNDSSVNPDALEIPYNGIDDDCSPLTLDDDLDGDGFLEIDDCDDSNPDINPDAEEIPDNGIDEDCDGSDLLTSIKYSQKPTFIIKPNPVSDFICITPDSNLNFKVQLINIYSKIVLETYNQEQIDVSKLSPGLYFVMIFDLNSNKSVSEKILIAR